MNQKRLRELIWYNPFNGEFRWMEARGSVTYGGLSATRNADGYVQVCLDGTQYYGHRLAWLWMTGEWPTLQIDHINRDKADNSWKNLRQVTNAENTMNVVLPRSTNKAGFLGVSPRKKGFIAQIVMNGKHKYLGQFPTPELASLAYQKAKAEWRRENGRLKVA